MINDYLIFVTLVITITILPGPAVILTIRNSVKYGYKMAFASITGNFLAMILLATLSAVGIGALIVTSPLLFSVMKAFGCLYLMYIGIKIWKSPYMQSDLLAQKGKQKNIRTLFKEGFTVGISNPKAIAFFTALFPQFIDPERAYLPQFFTLILTGEGLAITILSSYAIFASFATPYLLKERPMTLFNKFTGCAFMGYGLALLLSA